MRAGGGDRRAWWDRKLRTASSKAALLTQLASSFGPPSQRAGPEPAAPASQPPSQPAAATIKSLVQTRAELLETRAELLRSRQEQAELQQSHALQLEALQLQLAAAQASPPGDQPPAPHVTIKLDELPAKPGEAELTAELTAELAGLRQRMEQVEAEARLMEQAKDSEIGELNQQLEQIDTRHEMQEARALKLMDAAARQREAQLEQRLEAQAATVALQQTQIAELRQRLEGASKQAEGLSAESEATEPAEVRPSELEAGERAELDELRSQLKQVQSAAGKRYREFRAQQEASEAELEEVRRQLKESQAAVEQLQSDMRSNSGPSSRDMAERDEHDGRAAVADAKDPATELKAEFDRACREAELHKAKTSRALGSHQVEQRDTQRARETVPQFRFSALKDQRARAMQRGGSEAAEATCGQEDRSSKAGSEGAEDVAGMSSELVSLQLEASELRKQLAGWQTESAQRR